MSRYAAPDRTGLEAPEAPAAYVQTYGTADRTHAAPTAAAGALTAAATAATNVTPFGYTTAAQANAIKDAINGHAAGLDALVVDVADVKQLLNAVIDDLQALGLLG